MRKHFKEDSQVLELPPHSSFRVPSSEAGVRQPDNSGRRIHEQYYLRMPRAVMRSL